MKDEVNIPISADWSKEEVIDVVNFFEMVDQAYSKGAEKEVLGALYKRYKEIVPSKSEEKQAFKEYEKQTGQSPYHTVKKARESEERIIKM
ncbi:hypothetical protein CR205_04380 [Alteribacter lacisalsi]|uniref:Uncharacterized protein n=1 Tax=Alteribacter lacisalsi TaxID=2045244 RepID=A0A2W0HAK5_9BACI|nr:UPF0223 family protein [Alteribacter lacisalsi]PYZ97836.1 hypothetical protein CR205_04380 [Alteribacter lacisalsi]